MTLVRKSASRRQDGLLLRGLDGSNPLGFLAALGLFRVVGVAYTFGEARLQWVPDGGTWVPNIVGCRLDAESLLDLLESALTTQIGEHPIGILGALADDDLAQRRSFIARSTAQRQTADWVAALASDFTSPSANNQLQTARRDYYFGNLASVISRTTRKHLERAIFHRWDYADPLDNQSLHWDPSEDRRHAHQWNQPAGDPARKKSGGMLGANRLAIEAIVWFTSLPEGDALHSVGFTGQRSHNTRWTWPIWDAPISAATVRSTLMLPVLQESRISTDAADRLRRRGVVATFRSRRILAGKTPNFTPAEQIA